MDDMILTALDRASAPGRFREKGYIAGVLYGDGIASSIPVKFQEESLKKIVAKHGTHAKVRIAYGNDQKTGFIKEVQRNPVTWVTTHIDVQIVSKTEIIKMQLPIYYKGENLLSAKELRVQPIFTVVDVSGKMDSMPDSIEVDVSAKELGDTITRKDFSLDPQITVNDKEDEIYGSIVHLKAFGTTAAVAEEEVKAEA